MQLLEEPKALVDAPVSDTKVLIEEARERTRRRRLYMVAALIVIMIGALLGA
jgi:predicted nucleic acid-binding Zn ribbon protein